jgi:YVTN family beta-propeller protein
VTAVATKNAMVDDRVMIPEANLVQGIDFAPDGEFALVTLIRTKNLVPMTRVLQGWVITNGIGVLWRDGRVDQLLLDEPDNYFADPTDIAVTPDGRLAFVTGGGVDEVAVVDIERMRAVLDAASEDDRAKLLPNHLGVTTEFVERRIAVGSNPRGLAISPDGRFVYVAEALDDAVAVIDVERREKVATIDLGGPGEITLARKGERIFHSAEVTYGRQFSCHSCHPDGGIDNITYDIEPDGIGVNPVDNRTLRGILDTAPFKWTGKNPTISRQCGPRLAVFFTRIDPFTPEQVVALERYIRTIPRNPNRYRVGEELTPAQRRGKALFERSLTNTGEEIPLEDRCNGCHPGPYFTNRDRASVGTASELDTHDVFDVPHLNNIYESAPYLHDGRAETLEEIWTRFNPNDEHGVTNDMTKDQLNDLIEYLKTL